MTEFAHGGEWPAGVDRLPPVEVVELPREGDTSEGVAGTLVHAVLATAPLDADIDDVARAGGAGGPYPRRARSRSV